jgi:hypothetical protein
MNLYECTKCDRIFDNFPAANNHEKATGYIHLSYNVAYGVALAELANGDEGPARWESCAP